ncbi:tetratricopeptide repeat protein [Xylophilus sp.]|uniref:tetratricopeptide repeat protein n=1 Tax=Xylophilus sp. TaxID=2653893 RepID=UPI0013B937E9|nr:tetratricopeptide repeat protein [Xylophilus sp.]KAF1047395.1 MAG: hypothetical protein GAK38_01914 [Xylophilus sp.]
MAASLNLLALVGQRQGHADEAAGLLRKALAAGEQVPDGEVGAAALALNLGSALDAAGRGDEALTAWRRSLEIVERPPADAPVRAQALAARYNQRLLGDRACLSAALRAEALER